MIMVACTDSVYRRCNEIRALGVFAASAEPCSHWR